MVKDRKTQNCKSVTTQEDNAIPYSVNDGFKRNS